jgi:hypothetical protein
MKASSLFAAMLIISASLYSSLSFAQSVGTAADPKKQAGLEKNKAHQAEMEKKYKAMTPEQQVEAKKKANDYKNGGYKNKTGQGTKTSPTKPAQAPATKPAQTGVNQAKPTQAKPATTATQSGAKPKPIFLDANGKPLNSATPAAPAKPAVNSSKPVAPVKPAVVPASKTIQQAPASGAVKK